MLFDSRESLVFEDVRDGSRGGVKGTGEIRVDRLRCSVSWFLLD